MDFNTYLSRMRDLVNDYETLIERLKLVKGKAVSGDTALLKSMITCLNKLIARTEKILQEYDTYRNMEENGLAAKYLATYYSYLQLVSIPYTIDILSDIRKILSTYSDEKLVAEIDALIGKYRNLIFA